MRDDLPSAVFDSGTLNGFNMVGCSVEHVFLISLAQLLVGLFRQFCEHRVFIDHNAACVTYF